MKKSERLALKAKRRRQLGVLLSGLGLSFIFGPFMAVGFLLCAAIVIGFFLAAFLACFAIIPLAGWILDAWILGMVGAIGEGCWYLLTYLPVWQTVLILWVITAFFTFAANSNSLMIAMDEV